MQISDKVEYMYCNNCDTYKNIVKITTEDREIYLCYKCLQELNYKIVEYLAEKNL